MSQTCRRLNRSSLHGWPMDNTDRHRLAAEYGLDPAAIPEPQIIPRGISGDRGLTPREATDNAYRRYRLGRKLAAADRRAGFTGYRERVTWAME